MDDFQRAVSRYHRHGWESMSPGYWKLQDNALRRCLKNLIGIKTLSVTQDALEVVIIYALEDCEFGAAL